jgi:2-polyprenyl-3-methyl-5-hydroxy-6-metoxy-1,4-benzoquinol methylase
VTRFSYSSDRAGVGYWDHVWEGQATPDAVDPESRKITNHVYLCFDRFFSTTLADKLVPGSELIEVGCGRSRWLPYFANRFGVGVSGIDYSSVGCRQAEAILAKSGTRGAISHADIFDPPGYLLGRFDVVVSFGVVEHFDRPSDCIAMMARFGRPGGTLLTLVPNLAGVAGIMQKYLCRRIYDTHVVLDRDALAAIHRDAGLEVRSCEYFMGVNWTVVNLSCLPGCLQSLAVGVQLGLSAPCWLIERMGMRIPPNRVTSPYVLCVASAAGG